MFKLVYAMVSTLEAQSQSPQSSWLLGTLCGALRPEEGDPWLCSYGSLHGASQKRSSCERVVCASSLNSKECLYQMCLHSFLCGQDGSACVPGVMWREKEKEREALDGADFSLCFEMLRD